MQIGKLRKLFLQGIILASILSLIVLLPSHNTKAASSQTTTTVSIPATQPWTDTGIDLTQGSSVSIIASGTIYIAGSDPGKTPDGDPTCTASSDYVAPGLHCWSLIGNIANGTPFEVGSSTSFSASASGRLHLGVNDNVFGDNSGSWTATVTVTAPLPTIDLQTLDIHSLQPLVAGTNPTFRADIRNNGSIASGNFNIRWIADGTIFDGGHYSIPAGATDTHDHIWSNITPGNHTLTFIANLNHSITESDYGNNQFTLTFTVAAPTPKSNKLFVFIQGINSNYSGAGIPNDSFGGMISFNLKSVYPDADSLLYVYPHPHRGGNSNSYLCQDTFTGKLGDYVAALKSQIINYMQLHPNTQVHIIGHSMGGAIGFGLLADMKVHGYIHTNGGRIASVTTLDSPLGGVPEGPGLSHWYYDLTLNVFSDKNHCPAIKHLNLTGKALWQLTQVFGHAPYGPNDSLALVINGADFSNQEIATAAVRDGTHVLTVGNRRDFLYQPGDCTFGGLGPNTHFIGTQVINDKGNKSGIYSRLITDGIPGSSCSVFTDISINHGMVFFDPIVDGTNGYLVKLIAGKTP